MGQSDLHNQVLHPGKQIGTSAVCLNTIDGSHIPFCAPLQNHTDYYNRKGWYSMVVQAVVDHDYLFRDICVEWPGSVHDARIFVNSRIYKRITEDKLIERT